MKLERTRHRFTSLDKVDNYYQNTYIKPGTSAINDSTTAFSIKNTLGIALLEGFNKVRQSRTNRLRLVQIK